MIASPYASFTPLNMMKPYPKIVALGDSLVQGAFGPYGWGSALSSDYAGKFDVINRGMGGYNTRWILRKLKKDWYEAGDPAIEGNPSEEIKLVIIHLGTNDSTTKPGGNIPLDEFKSNLSSIITHFQTCHNSSILLLTPSTCNSEAWLTFLRMNNPDAVRSHDNASHRMYADAVLEVGAAYGVPAIDLYKIFEEKVTNGFKDEDLFLEGLHYTKQGYATITYAVRTALTAHFPEILPGATSESFEPWHTCGPDTELIERLKIIVARDFPGMTYEEGVQEFELRKARVLWDGVISQGDTL